MGSYLKAMYEMFKSQNQDIGFFDVAFEVEGKLIHAHKIILASVSEVLNRMISDTWNNGETIKIENYNYNDFYEFLTFVYSGKCKIDDENVFSMVDLSEFYQVKELQQKCDEYLSEKEYTIENVFTYFETLSNYSLPMFERTVSKAIKEKGINLIESDGFIETSKEIVMKIVKFEDGFISEEKLFEKIYEWAEKQAKKKQSESNEEIYNLNDAIKAELIEILPFVRFKKMNMNFLLTFVVKKGFLFSYDELSKILDTAFHVKVKITNEHGESIICNIPFYSDFAEPIKSVKNRPCDDTILPYCAFWNEPRIKIPSIPSQVKKRDGIEWYLICFSGIIGVMHRSTITSEYLLAEMVPETSGFEITQNCKFEIE